MGTSYSEQRLRSGQRVTKAKDMDSLLWPAAQKGPGPARHACWVPLVSCSMKMPSVLAQDSLTTSKLYHPDLLNLPFKEGNLEHAMTWMNLEDIKQNKLDKEKTDSV